VTRALPGLRGLTWDHPRGYAALAALAGLDAGGDTRYGAVPAPVVWDRQPLAGFESEPITGLAQRYDLLVIDHPGLGAATTALHPLDGLFGAGELAAWADAAAGPSFSSYRYAGHQWALPLDAATQVCVTRPELMDGRPPPGTWREVAALAREVPVALVLGGPHALLALLAICAAQGAPPVAEAAGARPHRTVPPTRHHGAAGGGGGAGAPAGGFADDATARDAVLAALDVLAGLAAHSDLALAAGSPIDVMEAMATLDTVACAPLVYGYVTYSEPSRRPHQLAVSDAPAWQPGGRPGSVLGGTGVAVSRRVTGEDAQTARAHLRRLLAGPVQTDLVPRAGGQPALRAAWESQAVNSVCGGFYRRTLATLDQAWTRPRFPGWIGFQERGSAVVRDGLMSRAAPAEILRQLRAEFHACCAAGGQQAP
jgi:multiple sugar transport system substrate-binding protein